MTRCQAHDSRTDTSKCHNNEKLKTNSKNNGYLRSESNASHGVKQVSHEKSSSMAPMTIVVTLNVDVSSLDRPNRLEHIASAYGMTINEKTRITLSNRIKGRRRPYRLRHLSLSRPITGTRKNPSAGPTPSIILMFCSLSQSTRQITLLMSSTYSS